MSETNTEEQTEQQEGSEAAPLGGREGRQEDGGRSLFDLAGQEPAPMGADGKPTRPEFLPEEFWDAEKGEARLEALAKSRGDLRKQVSQMGRQGKPPASPDGYEVPKVEGLPEGAVGGPKDELWQAVRVAAHKAGISQEQLNSVATPYLKQVAQVLARQAAENDPEARRQVVEQARREELEKLGEGGPALVREIGGWIKGMEASGVLTEAEAFELRATGTAAGIRALSKLRQLAGGPPIPTGTLDEGQSTQADLQRMLTEGYGRGDKDMVARADAGLARLKAAGQLRTGAG